MRKVIYKLYLDSDYRNYFSLFIVWSFILFFLWKIYCHDQAEFSLLIYCFLLLFLPDIKTYFIPLLFFYFSLIKNFSLKLNLIFARLERLTMVWIWTPSSLMFEEMKLYLFRGFFSAWVVGFIQLLPLILHALRFFHFFLI